MKARLYYFNKKTRKQDERAFDRLYRDLRCVTRANDPSKVLADNTLILLTNLVSMLLASTNKKICINQDFLSEFTGTEIDQNSNLLKQLKDIISYKYHRMARFEGNRYNYCYIIEFSEDGEKRASNPELFYTIDSKINLVRRGKKFGLMAEKIRPSYIDTREIKKEIEEEPLGYSSSISKKEKINKKKKENFQSAEIVQILQTSFEKTPQEEITEVPTLPTHPEITKKHEEVTPMKQQQIPIEPKRNMEFELSGAIFKSFGGVKSDEIMENCKFILINENKLGVQLSNGFSLTPTDRDRLKACIRLVYGDGISIVSSAVLKIAQPKPEILVKPQIQQYYRKWTKFRNDLLNYLPEKTCHHSLNTWFDKLRVSEDMTGNRIILTGSRFYVDSVYNRFQSAIEYVVTKNKVTLELHFENNEEKPIIYKPNGGF